MRGVDVKKGWGGSLPGAWCNRGDMGAGVTTAVRAPGPAAAQPCAGWWPPRGLWLGASGSAPPRLLPLAEPPMGEAPPAVLGAAGAVAQRHPRLG